MFTLKKKKKKKRGNKKVLNLRERVKTEHVNKMEQKTENISLSGLHFLVSTDFDN